MNTLEAIRLIALKGAVKPDAASNIRFVMRWYSKTFHTPLHVVEQIIPLEDIWLAFFEERYQNADPDTLDEAVAEAIETPAQKEERLRAEEAEKASEVEFAKLSEKMAKGKKIVDDASKKMEAIASMMPKLDAHKLPETEVTALTGPLEPDITMEFVDDEEMQKLLDGGMATQTPVDPLSFK